MHLLSPVSIPQELIISKFILTPTQVQRLITKFFPFLPRLLPPPVLLLLQPIPGIKPPQAPMQ